jgi:hypothetical protein
MRAGADRAEKRGLRPGGGDLSSALVVAAPFGARPGTDQKGSQRAFENLTEPNSQKGRFICGFRI